MSRYVITGGLGTGETSAISALKRTVETVPEPARELIAEHLAATGEPTLDHRPELFVERLISQTDARTVPHRLLVRRVDLSNMEGWIRGRKRRNRSGSLRNTVEIG